MKLATAFFTFLLTPYSLLRLMDDFVAERDRHFADYVLLRL